MEIPQYFPLSAQCVRRDLILSVFCNDKQKYGPDERLSRIRFLRSQVRDKDTQECLINGFTNAVYLSTKAETFSLLSLIFPLCIQLFEKPVSYCHEEAIQAPAIEGDTIVTILL